MHFLRAFEIRHSNSKPTPLMKLSLTLSLVLGIASFTQAGPIAEVMKKYHKGDDALQKKVGNGKASDVELAELLKAYQQMAAEKPPQGDAASWERRCKALITAVEALQKKQNNATSKYKFAVSCKTCHEVHKGE